MKIAIPLFGKRISPRFDVAPKIGLYNIEKGEVANYREILCEEGWDGLDRIFKLKELGVDTLICGGLPEYMNDMLHNDGIKIYHGFTGSYREALKRFLKCGRLKGSDLHALRNKRGGNENLITTMRELPSRRTRYGGKSP